MAIFSCVIYNQPCKGLELLKSFYAFEYSRKNDLNNHTNLPITLLTISGAAIFFIAQSLINITDCEFKTITGILLIISLILFVISFIYIIKFYFGHEYAFLPLPKDILKNLNDIKIHYDHQYYINLSPIQKEKNILDDSDKLFIDYYTEAVENNTKLNDKKSKYIYNSYKLIVCTLFVLFFTYCVYFYSVYNFSKNNIQKVELVNKSLKVEIPKITNTVSNKK